MLQILTQDAANFDAEYRNLDAECNFDAERNFDTAMCSREVQPQPGRFSYRREETNYLKDP